MNETITIQQVWASPDDKVRVITTSEQRKLNCYNSALFTFFTLGRQVEVEALPSTKKDGTPITKIVNVIVNGQPVLKEEKPLAYLRPPPSGEEKGMWYKEAGEMLRAGDIKDLKVHNFLRTAYYAQMFNVLGINIDEIKSKAKEDK